MIERRKEEAERQLLEREREEEAKKALAERLTAEAEEKRREEERCVLCRGRGSPPPLRAAQYACLT